MRRFFVWCHAWRKVSKRWATVSPLFFPSFDFLIRKTHRLGRFVNARRSLSKGLGQKKEGDSHLEQDSTQRRREESLVSDLQGVGVRLFAGHRTSFPGFFKLAQVPLVDFFILLDSLHVDLILHWFNALGRSFHLDGHFWIQSWSIFVLFLEILTISLLRFLNLCADERVKSFDVWSRKIEDL